MTIYAQTKNFIDSGESAIAQEKPDRPTGQETGLILNFPFLRGGKRTGDRLKEAPVGGTGKNLPKKVDNVIGSH